MLYVGRLGRTNHKGVWAAFVRRENWWRDATGHGAQWGVGRASAGEGVAPAGCGLRGVSECDSTKIGERSVSS